MKARQGLRLGLVALHTATRASNKGLPQNDLCAFRQTQQPLQVHSLLLRTLGLDVLRQVVKETRVFVLLKGFGKAASQVFFVLVLLAVGEQQHQRLFQQFVHFTNGFDAFLGQSGHKRALATYQQAAHLLRDWHAALVVARCFAITVWSDTLANQLQFGITGPA